MPHRARYALPALALALAVLCAGALAQYLRLHELSDASQIGLLWGITIGAFLLALLLAPGAPLPVQGSLLPEGQRVRWGFLLLALVLGGLTWLQTSGNRFTGLGVLAWAGCLLAYAAAFWEHTPRPERSPGVESTTAGLRLPLSWEVIALAGVLLLALFMRTYQLDRVPIEGNSDHYEKLLDVNDVLTGKAYIFFERNTGREPMQFYLAAAIIELFDTGLTHFSLKLSNLVMGMLTVVGTYLLGREVGGARVGLLAAFFVAVSFWVLAPSRVGLRYPFAPAWSALSLWGLMRAIRRQDRGSWIVAGALLGLGLHGYTSHRIVPLVATLIAGLYFLFPDRPSPSLGRWAANFTLYVGAALVVFLPLLHYMVESPDMFWSRALTRSTDVERDISRSTLDIFAETFSTTLGQFHWTGDDVYVSAIRDLPALDTISAVLLVMGALYAIIVLIGRRPALSLSLLVGTVVLLLPSGLSFAFPNESPSTVRSGSAVPFIALLVALPLPWLLDRTREALPGPRGRWLGAGLLVVLLGVMALSNFERYFGRYADEYRLRAMNVNEIADTLIDLMPYTGDADHVFLRDRPHWLDARGLSFRFGDVDWHKAHSDIELAPLLERAPEDGQPLIFVLRPDDRQSVLVLSSRFPNGHAIEYESRAGGHWNYILYFVPPGDHLMKYSERAPLPYAPHGREFERLPLVP